MPLENIANTALEKQLDRFYWIKSVENILWKQCGLFLSWLTCLSKSIFFDRVKELVYQAYCVKKLQTKKSGCMWK